MFLYVFLIRSAYFSSILLLITFNFQINVQFSDSVCIYVCVCVWISFEYVMMIPLRNLCVWYNYWVCLQCRLFETYRVVYIEDCFILASVEICSRRALLIRGGWNERSLNRRRSSYFRRLMLIDCWFYILDCCAVVNILVFFVF